MRAVFPIFLFKQCMAELYIQCDQVIAIQNDLFQSEKGNSWDALFSVRAAILRIR
jgi:hypothetical protein